MKLSQLNNETKTHIAAAVAAGALCAEAVANAVERPNIRTIPTAVISMYLHIGLSARMVRAIRNEKRKVVEEVIQTMDNSQEMKDAMNPFK